MTVRNENDMVELVQRVCTCRDCSQVLPVPHAPAGPATATVAVVAQNPAVGTFAAAVKAASALENNRYLTHVTNRCGGCFRLHQVSPGPSGWSANERKVRRLLDVLGVLPEQVYATQALKCPTLRNRPPGAKELASCRRYLAVEVQLVPARLWIALGRPAVEALRRVLPSPPGWAGARGHNFKTFNGITARYTCRVREVCSAVQESNLYVLELPHPSTAGRFYPLDDWLAAARRLAAPVVQRSGMDLGGEKCNSSECVHVVPGNFTTKSP